MKSTKVLALSAVGIGTLFAVIVYPVFAQAKMGSRRATPAMMAKWRAESKAYNDALQQWQVKHNYAAAETQFQDIVLKHRSSTCSASVALAEMLAEEGNYAKALKWYRAVLVYPHPGWSSTDQRNITFIGGYADTARRAGSVSETLTAERMLLDAYVPSPDAPVFAWNSDSSKDVHACACMVRALNRTGQNNGVAFAQEAARSKPSDPAILWLTGMVLEDARQYEEARAKYQACHDLPGLNERSRKRTEERIKQLTGMKSVAVARQAAVADRKGRV